MNSYIASFRSCIIASVLALSTLTASAAANFKVTANADSSVIEMGDRTMVHVSVTAPTANAIPVEEFKPNTTYHGVDIIDVNSDTTALTGGGSRVEYNVLIQAFDPGMVTLPPFRFALGTDTAESDIVTLKVTEVDLDSLTTINPMESIVAPNSKWYDVIPDWWYWVVIGLAVVAIGVGLYILYRKNGSIIIKRKPVIPPYELAIQQLNELRTQKLAELGQEKEYYTRLTDILRQYLDGRFGINAMEMSSTQILYSIKHNDETKMSTEQIQQILEIADFVKFAKVRPLPDDNIKTFNSALDFVEATKPAPIEGEDADNATTDKGKSKKNKSAKK
jgi:hypothetical protein